MLNDVWMSNVTPQNPQTIPCWFRFQLHNTHFILTCTTKRDKWYALYLHLASFLLTASCLQHVTYDVLVRWLLNTLTHKCISSFHFLYCLVNVNTFLISVMKNLGCLIFLVRLNILSPACIFQSLSFVFAC